MPDVDLTIAVPSVLADRLAGEAAGQHLSTERYAARLLMAEVLRRDTERHAAWIAARPEEHAAERRSAALDEIDREVARLIDDGLDPAEGAALAERLLAEYDATQSPGYLDPRNTALPMTAERHIAILQATLRAEHEQHISEIERFAEHAAARGDEPARRRYLDRVARLRAMQVP